MEGIKNIVIFILSLMGVTVDNLDPSKVLTDRLADIFSTASTQLYGIFTANGAVMQLIIPIGIVVSIIYWLIGMMDKVDSERFTTEILVKNLMRLVIGIIIISNSFNIAAKFDQFTNYVIEDLDALGADKNEQETASQQEKMAASAQKKYNRLFNDDIVEEEEEEGDGTTEETTEAPATPPPSSSGSYPESECQNPEAIAGTTPDWYKNAELVAQVLTEAGYSPAAISGILGNLTHESYINPNLKEGGDIGTDYVVGKGYGLFQLTRDYAAVYEQYGHTADSQMRFIVNEMETEYNTFAYGYHTIEEFKTIQDPVLACELFAVVIERPGHEATGQPLETDLARKIRLISVPSSGGLVNKNSERIAYTKWYANNMQHVYGNGSSSKPFLKDIFSNSVSMSEATDMTVEIILIGIVSIAVTFSLYSLAYSRAIKICYLLIFAPIATGKMFVSNKMSEGLINYFKQLLAAFFTYPAVYLICKFYILILNEITQADGDLFSLLGTLLISVVAMIVAIKNISNGIEKMLT